MTLNLGLLKDYLLFPLLRDENWISTGRMCKKPSFDARRKSLVLNMAVGKCTLGNAFITNIK